MNLRMGSDLALSFFLTALVLPQWPSKAQIDVVSKMEQIYVASSPLGGLKGFKTV